MWRFRSESFGGTTLTIEVARMRKFGLVNKSAVYGALAIEEAAVVIEQAIHWRTIRSTGVAIGCCPARTTRCAGVPLWYLLFFYISNLFRSKWPLMVPENSNYRARGLDQKNTPDGLLMRSQSPTLRAWAQFSWQKSSAWFSLFIPFYQE